VNKEKTPKIISRYTIGARIGSGASGAVYEARETSSGNCCAIKMLSEGERTKRASARLIREFTFLADLEHPNLVKVLDLGSDKLLGPFIVMEYAEGVPITKFFKQPRIDTLLVVLQQVLDALSYMHRSGFLHGDVKPAHILVSTADSEEPKAKLLDLGLAYRHERDCSVDSLGGTPGYIAPEMFCGGVPDCRSDLYSLGVVLYEVLTRRLPFMGDELSSTFMAQMTETPPSPAMVNGGVPYWLSDIVTRLISKDPADRFGSARSILLQIAEKTGCEAVLHRGSEGMMGLLEPAFIGRREQLKTMLEAFRRGPSEKGELILIHGEEGIGKTRLLREHRFKLRLESGLVISTSGTLGPAKLLFKDVIDQLRGLLEFDLSDYPHLAHMLNGRPTVHQNEYERAAGSLKERRIALFEEILDILRKHRPSDAPVALLIDDLDEAPATFAAFVRHLARSLDSVPGLLVYATASGTSSDKVDPELEQRGTVLPLSGLNLSEAGELVASMFGEPNCSDEVKETFLGLSGGNPLFLQETVRAMAASGSLSVEEGVFSLKAQDAVECTTSDMLKQVLRRRLDGIPDDERSVLQAGSVLGQSFEFGLLKKVCGIRRVKTLWRRLLALRSMGILVEAEDGHFSFRHQLAQQLVYRDIEDSERRRLHLAAANSIKKGRSARSGLVGYHFALAGHGDEAVPLLLQAAQEAKNSFFTQDAESYLSRAVSVWPEAGRDDGRYLRAMLDLADARAALGQAQDAASAYEDVWDAAGRFLSVEERCSLARRRGLSLASIGQAQEALQWYHKVSEEMGDISAENEAFLSNSIGMAHYSAGDYAAAKSHFERVLELLKDDHSPELARAYRHLSIVADAQGQLDGAISYARRGLDVADAAGDEREKAHARVSLGIRLGRRGETQAAIDEFAGALSFFEPRRSLEALACIYNNLGNEFAILGDLESVLKYRKDAFMVSRLIDDKMAAIYAYRGLGSVHLSLGNWEDAQREFSESLRLCEDLGESRQVAIALRWQGHFQALSGKLGEARRNVERSLTLLGDSGDKADLISSLLVLSRIDRELGDFKRAQERAQDALDIAEGIGLAIDRSAAAIELAHLLLEQDAVDEADGVFTQFISPSLGTGSELGRCRALLLASRIRLMQGRLSDAKSPATRVKVICEKSGAVYDGALAQLLLSEVAISEKSYQKAKKILDGTLPAFKRLGAALDVARAEELLEKVNTMTLEDSRLSADLTLIFEMSQIFNSMLDLDELLNQVMDYVLQKMTAERGIILLKNETSQNLEVVVARNVDRQTIEDVSETSNSIVDGVMEKGEAVVSTSAMDDPRFKSKQSIMLNKIRSLVCVPLKIRDEIVGTIYVDNRITAGLFSDDDVKFLTAFSNYVAMAIDRSKMYESLRVDRERLATENIELRKSAGIEFGFDSILGDSEAMQRVFDLMRRVVPTSATVLILGRSGTGKELVARAIHYCGPRKDKPFVKVNCATLPENLLESELFGHEKGAYTGADKRKFGKFELADTGTIFLDEIAEIKPSLQAKLLQVIEEKRFERVGGTRQITADVRILAATNRDISEELESGAFREDLYYRLCEVIMQLPNLADRVDDIPVLSAHFISQFAEDLGREIEGITDEAMAVLKSYHWPGNVRELKHALYRAVIAGHSRELDADDILNVLPVSPDGGEPTFLNAAAKEVIKRSRKIASSDAPLKRARAVFEGYILKEVLKDAGDNISEAARRLGIHRKSFRHLIDEYENLG